MTLAKMPNSGDIEPEETTSSTQTGPSVERQGHQPTYKTFNPKLLLSKRNAETEGVAEWSTDQPNLGSILQVGTNP